MALRKERGGKLLVRLRKGDWSAVVEEAEGANCISLRNARYRARLLREWEGDGEKDDPYLYGMPILFPVNRIRGGRFLFEGREYCFPVNEPATGCHLHGELHRMLFRVIEREEHRLLCRYEAEAGEYLSFPHAFSVTREVELREEGLWHFVTGENRSSSKMPLMLGFHTTFSTAFTETAEERNVRARVRVLEEYERNLGGDYLPTGRLLERDRYAEALDRGELCPVGLSLSRHLKSEGDMLLEDRKRGLRLRYRNDSRYGFRLIYAREGEGFLCMEPQTCLVDCLNSPFPLEKTGFFCVNAGESLRLESSITLEEIV